ncbi:MAG: hypothetical protein GYB67_05655 [Chloroflexi bacterium]|nr:hypothetical protein [Chloroflexota bacterium]
MALLAEIIGVLFLAFGIGFSAIGVLGLIRFPDVYSRIHASGKVATLGLFGILVGVAFLVPETTLRAIALGIFVILTLPVASHAIASAAYRLGVPVNGRDDLARDPASKDPDVVETPEQAQVPAEKLDAEKLDLAVPAAPLETERVPRMSSRTHRRRAADTVPADHANHVKRPSRSAELPSYRPRLPNHQPSLPNQRPHLPASRPSLPSSRQRFRNKIR